MKIFKTFLIVLSAYCCITFFVLYTALSGGSVPHSFQFFFIPIEFLEVLKIDWFILLFILPLTAFFSFMLLSFLNAKKGGPKAWRIILYAMLVIFFLFVCLTVVNIISLYKSNKSPSLLAIPSQNNLSNSLSR